MLNTPYHKIQSLFKRDPETNYKTFIEGAWTLEEFQLLRNIEWQFTEKIDGTNIRVMFDEVMEIAGRSNNADIPAKLVSHINETLPTKKLEEVFPAVRVVLIGEGYGAGIQKGGNYRQDQGFILFDVWLPDTDYYLSRENVENVAYKLGIPFAPVIHQGPLLDGIDLVKGELKSKVSQVEQYAEGVVARPAVELKDKQGRRIITKIKRRDYQL